MAANGEQLYADTAIIQLVSITPSIYGDKFGEITPFSKTTGSGKAVMLRDGFSYVMRIDADSRVIQTKVNTGRRTADRIEITSGLKLSDQVVATGGAFLGDGDLVQIASRQPDAQQPAKPSATTAALTAPSDDVM